MNGNDNRPRPPIVVGIDGSAGAMCGATWAADLAQRRGVGLRLLNALNLTGAASLLSRWTFDEYRRICTKDAETLLGAVSDELHSRFPLAPITTEITDGAPVEELVEASGTAALTVVGMRGRGGFPGLGLGSVGLRLAAHCHGPAVLVPAGYSRIGEQGNGEVVLGVEEREPGEVVRFAFDLAEQLGADLRAVAAWQTIPPYNGYYYIEPVVLRTAAESRLSTVLEPVRSTHANVPVIEDITCAEPAAALNRASHGARLLVLGAHRRRTLFSIGVGPVLHALLVHAPCPVAVVPATSGG
jgi:nucleotide-binding universal stress UspA family protein